MKRRILSVLAGVVVGWVVVSLGEMLQHQLFPPPEGLNVKDKEAIKAYAENLPDAAFAVLLGVWLCSALLGGLVAGKLGQPEGMRSALLTGAILLATSILNMVLIPHPVWLMVCTVILYLPFAYAGGRLGTRI